MFARRIFYEAENLKINMIVVRRVIFTKPQSYFQPKIYSHLKFFFK